MICIGIDPGVNGGIAAIDSYGKVVIAAKMPENYSEIIDLFTDISGPWGRALLEKAHASPQMGVSSAFTYGCGFGALQMALAAQKIQFDFIGSAKWQRALGCLSHGDKNVTKNRALQLFPNVKVTHSIADALLIAEYLRRLSTGEFK